MNKKIFFILALTFISAPTYAFQGNGFKIVSEKTFTSPSFKGGFQANNKKITSLFTSALSWAYNAEGRINEYIKVQGDHSISISNYSSETKRYTYTYLLSCENAYEQFERTVEIYPRGNFSDSAHSYGTVQKEQTGTFPINVATKIKGAEEAWHDAQAVLRVR